MSVFTTAFAICFVTILHWGAPVLAIELFVDNVGGDDTNDGKSPESIAPGRGPMRTIRATLRRAGPRDHIVLGKTDVPYRENITLTGRNNSGDFNRPLVIFGNGQTLDGTKPVPPSSWTLHRGEIFRYRPRLKHHAQLYVNGKPGDRVAVKPGAIRLPDLKPQQWCLFEREIYFRVEPLRHPQQYDLRYAAIPVGIALYKVRNVVISDLVVQGFQLDGIRALDDTSDCLLSGVTCRGCGRSGISIDGGSRLEVNGSLVGNNGVAQVRTSGYCIARLFKCNVIGNTAPAYNVTGGQLFVDGKRVEQR